MHLLKGVITKMYIPGIHVHLNFCLLLLQVLIISTHHELLFYYKECLGILRLKIMSNIKNLKHVKENLHFL